jgi:cyclic pyranopterin phosphate synthase
MPSKTKSRLTHLDAEGAARMLDVTRKRPTLRRAVARAVVELGPLAASALSPLRNPKGDAFAVARIAGIQAAKRTSEWIPLCHPVVFDSVEVSLERMERSTCVEIRAAVGGTGKTGFEMEAMVAASAAALALYDMCKGVEKGIRIGPIELVSKTGGKSGSWSRKLRG